MWTLAYIALGINIGGIAHVLFRNDEKWCASYLTLSIVLWPIVLLAIIIGIVKSIFRG